MKLKFLSHRRLLLISLGAIILVGIGAILFFKLKPAKIPPYVATYQVETQITFGDIYRNQFEKVVVNHLDGSYKSERFVNDIALLQSTYNTPDGFVLCSQNEDFDCQRLGDALTKNVGRPPKINGLEVSRPVTQKINIAGQDRSCQETTYTLPTATDPNTLIQEFTATVCLDDELKIPILANLNIRYRLNDIIKLEDLTFTQTRTLTELDTAPNLSATDFTNPTQQ